ncbi:MAG: 5'-nucleotidase [Clostridia bacterium]|nr:5'-nucleotidase [Clostridia bacterium]
MKMLQKAIALLLALGLLCGLAATASAVTFTDAHGNEIELDDTLEAYTGVVLSGADDAARKGETNLGDLWTDALRWFAVSGTINAYFEEDDVTAGNTSVAVDADHIVALWNGGNLRADVAEGKFGAEQLAEVLPYPNKVAVVYMTGAQLAEALEAASQALPYTEENAAACASFLQVSGLKYTLDTAKEFDPGEAYGDKGLWFKAASLGRVTIEEVNGQPFDAEAAYAVITSNANFNGMDSSYVFKTAAEENEKSTITTAVVRDVVWLFIANELNNQIGEAYAEAQGRIIVK